MILTPALAYPEIVFIRLEPEAVAENTRSRRVPAVTGIAKPFAVPLLVLPKATIPVNPGASVTTAPGIAVKLLSGAVELYN